MEKEENLKDNLKNESTKSSNLLQTNELLQQKKFENIIKHIR